MSFLEYAIKRLIFLDWMNELRHEGLSTLHHNLKRLNLRLQLSATVCNASLAVV